MDNSRLIVTVASMFLASGRTVLTVATSKLAGNQSELERQRVQNKMFPEFLKTITGLCCGVAASFTAFFAAPAAVPAIVALSVGGWAGYKVGRVTPEAVVRTMGALIAAPVAAVQGFQAARRMPIASTWRQQAKDILQESREIAARFSLEDVKLTRHGLVKLKSTAKAEALSM